MAELQNNLERNQVYLPRLDYRRDHIVVAMNPQQVHELMHNFNQLIALLHHVMMLNNNNNNNQPVPGNNLPNGNVQILELDTEDGINNLLPLYVGAQGFIFNSAFFVEGRTGCEILWTPFILSGLVSLATIVAVLKVFFQQFTQLRDKNYWSWVAEKVAIIMMLIAFSVCLLLCCTSVLCISGR